MDKQLLWSISELVTRQMIILQKQYVISSSLSYLDIFGFLLWYELKWFFVNFYNGICVFYLHTHITGMASKVFDGKVICYQVPLNLLPFGWNKEDSTRIGKTKCLGKVFLACVINYLAKSMIHKFLLYLISHLSLPFLLALIGLLYEAR